MCKNYIKTSVVGNIILLIVNMIIWIDTKIRKEMITNEKVH